MANNSGVTAEAARARTRAREMFIESGGRLSGKALSDCLKADGFGYFSSTALNRWKKTERWETTLAPVTVSAVQRAARSRELQDLIAEKGGEVLIFEGVYAEMLLGAASVAGKLLAWAESVDVKKLDPSDALAMMKALPALVDKTVGLKDTLSDLRFRGATDTREVLSDTSGGLNGEVLPPEKTSQIVQADTSAPHPALSEALATVIRAKKQAATLQRDVAPKARASLRA
jgi:hypothetical protein